MAPTRTTTTTTTQFKEKRRKCASTPDPQRPTTTPIPPNQTNPPPQPIGILFIGIWFDFVFGFEFGEYLGFNYKNSDLLNEYECEFYGNFCIFSDLFNGHTLCPTYVLCIMGIF